MDEAVRQCIRNSIERHRAERDPVWFAERVLGIEKLDDWQSDLLRKKPQRYILNCHRQSGKSTTVSVDALHTAAFESESLVLLVSPSLRQSSELFRKVADAYRKVEGIIPADSDLKLTLELRNGSRIVSLPGTEGTIRGFSGARLILMDEAARIPDLLYAAVRPMLAVSGGRLGMLSSPFGQQGFFHQTWKDGDPAVWEKVMVRATECPRITPEFLTNERREMSAWEFAQEYMCEFMEDEFAAFSFADVDKAMRGEVVEEWKL
jgi:hypothetical protein